MMKPHRLSRGGAGGSVKSEGSDSLLVHGNRCAEHIGMIERDHTPNAGTGLPGAHFSRRSRQAPTDDRTGSGRL